MLCDYGCGNEANFYSKWNKKHRCCEFHQQCPEVRRKASEKSSWNKGLPSTFKDKHHSEESKKKIAQAKMGNMNATHRGDRQSYYGETRMDSRWEVGTAQYLDKMNICWKYSERGYKLSDGRYYYPDFFIYEDGNLVKLVEVKGYFRESNKLKFEVFLRDYPNINIEIWDKFKLRELGIIDTSGYVKDMR